MRQQVYECFGEKPRADQKSERNRETRGHSTCRQRACEPLAVVVAL